MRNNFGFTLVEILVTVGITSVIVLALTSQLKLANEISIKEVNRQDALSLSRELTRILEKDINCTVSLNGLTVGTKDGDKTKLAGLYVAEADPSNPLKMIKSTVTKYEPDQIYNKTALKQLELKIVRPINVANRIYLGEISYNLIPRAKSDEENVAIYNFPPTTVLLELDASNKILNCLNDTTNEIIVKQRYCEISSGGLDKFDPETGECVKKFDGEWFEGTPYESSCPSGYIALGNEPGDVCGNTPPAGFKDTPAAEAKRKYKNGRVDYAAPDYYLSDFASNTCSCVYAESINDASAFRCKVLCFSPTKPK